jgi:hypothetical protein
LSDDDESQDIEYLHTIVEFVEIFEFAARLALSPAGDARMHIEIELEGLKNRRLMTRSRTVYFSRDYRTQMARWNHCWEGFHTDLIARPRELAALAAQEFFARFGLNVAPEILTGLQQKMAR